ncbi:MAG: hypothetical protein NUV65_00410 [Candidatus Roizmanbacteria bacterium]|nr:hypothetical protein [Candidatus Roizmanbacteria bacterium]
MVENGQKPPAKQAERGNLDNAGCISFHGGKGGYEVWSNGSPPPSVGELPSAQVIYEQDYRAGTSIGGYSGLTADQLKQAAAHNAGLPVGASGVMTAPYKGVVQFYPKRIR